MRIPPCQSARIVITLGAIAAVVISIICIAALTGSSARNIAWNCGLVVLILMPFLHWTQIAVYDEKPAPLDTMIGLPLVYVYAQQDAWLFHFSWRKLLTDVSLGLTLAGVVIAIVPKMKKRDAQHCRSMSEFGKQKALKEQPKGEQGNVSH